MTIIENPAEAHMQITVKEGKELKRYEASGKIGEGKGCGLA
nr:DUF2149 domain-containing protein [Falsochrobactrum shanghaiense]